MVRWTCCPACHLMEGKGRNSGQLARQMVQLSLHQKLTKQVNYGQLETPRRAARQEATSKDDGAVNPCTVIRKNPLTTAVNGFPEVGDTGLEPVTPSLSRLGKMRRLNGFAKVGCVERMSGRFEAGWVNYLAVAWRSRERGHREWFGFSG